MKTDESGESHQAAAAMSDRMNDVKNKSDKRKIKKYTIREKHDVLQKLKEYEAVGGIMHSLSLQLKAANLTHINEITVAKWKRERKFINDAVKFGYGDKVSLSQGHKEDIRLRALAASGEGGQVVWSSQPSGKRRKLDSEQKVLRTNSSNRKSPPPTLKNNTTASVSQVPSESPAVKQAQKQHHQAAVLSPQQPNKKAILTFPLPTGPLGLTIRKTSDGIVVQAIASSASSSPLKVGDCILSMNGVNFASLEGGVNGVADIIKAYSNSLRIVDVQRTTPLSDTIEGNVKKIAAPTANKKKNMAALMQKRVPSKKQQQQQQQAQKKVNSAAIAAAAVSKATTGNNSGASKGGVTINEIGENDVVLSLTSSFYKNSMWTQYNILGTNRDVKKEKEACNTVFLLFKEHMGQHGRFYKHEKKKKNIYMEVDDDVARQKIIADIRRRGDSLKWMKGGDGGVAVSSGRNNNNGKKQIPGKEDDKVALLPPVNQTSKQQLVTLTLPPGPLGVTIEESYNGMCTVVKISSSTTPSPFHVGDIILSLNSINLLSVPDGIKSWSRLFQDVSSVQKIIVVQRSSAKDEKSIQTEAVSSLSGALLSVSGTGKQPAALSKKKEEWEGNENEKPLDLKDSNVKVEQIEAKSETKSHNTKDVASKESSSTIEGEAPAAFHASSFFAPLLVFVTIAIILSLIVLPQLYGQPTTMGVITQFLAMPLFTVAIVLLIILACASFAFATIV